MLGEQSYLFHVSKEAGRKEGTRDKDIPPVACVFFLSPTPEVSNTSQSKAHQLRNKLSHISVVWEGCHIRV